MTSKSRVAPLKLATIPRLELVAVHLLSKLLLSVSNDDLSIPLSQINAGTDSRIVLCWFQKNPSTLKMFVSHRVASVQQMIPADHWRYVPTHDNPADLASRGIDSQALISSTLWWEGPSWLGLPSQLWPMFLTTNTEEVPELRATVVAAVQVIKLGTDFSLWTRYSSFHKLTCVVSWIRRFFNNSQTKSRNSSSTLTSDEVQDAKTCLLRAAQRMTYAEVFESIRSGRNLPPHHSLSKFDLSLGADQLIRISGRVRDPDSPLSSRSLILLSLNFTLTKLFLSTLHVTYKHAGISSLMSVISETY